ncbi:aspartate/glutamate racemase family protein [Kribbella sp. NPDC056951]|uniref:aspartate/glutamate racemase family protein n=1 Tax=Kribbella sp. NPDC056951 TaxID=3345978 RepID=UPI003637351A
MEIIGVLGGMSWESTAEYLRLLNQGVRDRLGGLHSARLRVATVDFAQIEHLQATNNWPAAGQILAREAADLEAAGATLILIATNTMRKVYDTIAAAVTVPVLHLGDVTANAVRAQGLTHIGLLATRYTMEQTFYTNRLTHHGIQTLVPDASARTEIQRIIYTELCVGLVSQPSRQSLIHIANDLITQGAQGIVLGCTELELTLTASDLPVPVFPTTTLHCTAALDHAVQNPAAN